MFANRQAYVVRVALHSGHERATADMSEPRRHFREVPILLQKYFRRLGEQH